MTRNRAVEPGRSEGYSLVEFLTVITCAAILLTAAVPNIAHLQQVWSLWGSARILEASLQWGRMHAITANAPLLFEVDDSRKMFHWVDPATGDSYESSARNLLRGVRVVKCPKSPLRFYQNGNAAPAGTYMLENEAGSCSVVVAPGGRIRFQKN